jgi:hypothetical protein
VLVEPEKEQETSIPVFPTPIRINAELLRYRGFRVPVIGKRLYCDVGYSQGQPLAFDFASAKEKRRPGRPKGHPMPEPA